VSQVFPRTAAKNKTLFRTFSGNSDRKSTRSEHPSGQRGKVLQVNQIIQEFFRG